LISPEAEARAFWRLRARMLRTLLRQTFASARLRLSLVLVLSSLLWYGLFRLMHEGFAFLQVTLHQPNYDQLLSGIFGTFFGALLMMLIFSSSIILYASLFRSQEVCMLLTLPVRDERVFLHKFQEAVVLSSWGFLLLGSPMLMAYGIVNAAPWYYYAMLPALMIGFVYIPVALGGIVCLEVMYHLPKVRGYLVTAVGLLLLAAAAWSVYSSLVRPESDLLTPEWFQHVLARLELTKQPLLPSWWLSAGLLQTAEGDWSEGLMFLTVMTANALFFRQLGVWRAARIYRAAYSTLHDLGGGRKRAWAGRLDRMLGKLASGLPRPVQILIIKDLRLFRRDPAQWSQFLIFFGLLGLYFINVRRFNYNAYYAGWVSMVSFLNLSVVGLLMSTFTTRFIFPMISLEGRRFWLLGLLPVRRDTILWSKLAFAVGGSLLPCAALVLLSDVSLRVPTFMLLHHQLTCALLCLGLSGIAVGLGARLPNLREQSPARIAAGFGGTLNLVLSTLYIIVIVLLMTLPCHFYQFADSTQSVPFHEVARLREWLWTWLVWGTAGSILVGALATAVPLWIGFRAFRRQEF
jgi:ABC-2 type transport system permease protein